ncbi:MAG: hypothetical protein WC792_03200 [Candidatus Micrarchaeia archaeon]|jgi:hypothetical protein
MDQALRQKMQGIKSLMEKRDFHRANSQLSSLALGVGREKPPAEDARELCRLAFGAWKNTFDRSMTLSPAGVHRPVGVKGFYSVPKKGFEDAHGYALNSIGALLAAGFSQGELLHAARESGLSVHYRRLLESVHER